MFPPIVALFGDVGAPEMLILLVIIVALLLLGPTKIPELARGLGKAMGEFRRGKAEFDSEINRAVASSAGSQYQPPMPAPSILRAAEELGVDTRGKSERDLKLDIVRAMDREAEQRVIAAAKILGVRTDNQPLNDVKMQIIRSINI